ncbi:hypothetical protein LguiA_000472 [Lonicera macranthoides]
MLFASQLLRIPEILPASVDHDSSAFDTAEPKPTMKENQNRVLLHSNGNGKDSDRLASEITNKDYFFHVPEYECSMVVDDFAGGKETKVKNSVSPYTIPTEMFGKGADFYTNKNVMECELPELIVCYKGSAYHAIKEICVDEGVPLESVETEFLTEDEVKPSSSEDCECDDGIKCGEKENVDTDLNIPDGLSSSPKADKNVSYEYGFVGQKSLSESDSDMEVADECGPGDPVEAGEENCNSTDHIMDDASTEEFVSDSSLSVKKYCPQTSLKDLFYASKDVGQQPGQISCAEAVPKNPALVPPTEETKKSPNSMLCYDSKVESGTITFNFGTCKPASSSKDQSDNVLHRPLELQSEPFHDDATSDSLSGATHVHHCEGESSFSMLGPGSGLITYSGPIPFSGSISLRSDSSTTSTRSFAFPVLQPEWSSSPVRMAKADRRLLRKHRGWRHGLLCCRF